MEGNRQMSIVLDILGSLIALWCIGVLVWSFMTEEW